jgi:hypothetical protein
LLLAPTSSDAIVVAPSRIGIGIARVQRSSPP